MSIFFITLSIWKLTKLSVGQGDLNNIFWPASLLALAFSVTSHLHLNFNKNRIKLILNRVVVGVTWFLSHHKSSSGSQSHGKRLFWVFLSC